MVMLWCAWDTPWKLTRAALTRSSSNVVTSLEPTSKVLYLYLYEVRPYGFTVW